MAWLKDFIASSNKALKLMRDAAGTATVSMLAIAPLSSCALAQSGVNRSAIIIVGAAGEDEFGTSFRESAERWHKCIGEAQSQIVGEMKTPEDDPANDQQRLLNWIANPPAKDNDVGSLPERWIVFIGHGTHDKDSTKINLQGPDLSAVELAKALNDAPKASWVIVICSSSSGPFINALSGSNRIVITATKSGAEQNYSRFGEYLSQSISDLESDLDHDREVSLLEAFLSASNRVAKFYEDAGRLASEQALLDDNGDARGTPAVFYKGTRAVKAPAENLQLDGAIARRMIVSHATESNELAAELRLKVDELESRVELLRQSKSKLPEDDYYDQLEVLMIEIAKIRTGR